MDAARKQEIVPAEEAQTPATVSESAAIFGLIERMALNPQVDVDRLERLLNMQERVTARNAKTAYAAAMSRMQSELPVIEERGATDKSTYAKWEDIVDQIKPVLAKHGFALSFRTGRDGDKILVTGVLSHEQGHSEETEMPFPVDTGPGRNAIQSVGSSLSYGKRYVAAALLNLTSRKSEDDDGKAAGAGETITEEQAVELRKLLDDTDSDVAKFCRFFKIGALSDLPAAKLEEAKRRITGRPR